MPDTQPYDYILAGGTVIDGSNTPGVKADVACAATAWPPWAT